MIYIVIKDWIDFSICNKHRIINEFTVSNTTLDRELKNCKKLSPKKIEVNENQHKITLFV